MSSYLKIKNRAISALAADITDVATSLTVTAGEGAKFPSAGDFHITIEDEILKCTARTTDTLTVVRAQEGTTGAAHIAGKSVELRITAGVIESRTTWTAEKLLKGAGAGVDPTEIDVPAILMLAEDLQEFGKPGVGTFANPAYINDGDTVSALSANTIGQYCLVILYSLVTTSQFRFFKHARAGQNNDAEFKLQYWNEATGAYVDWITNVVVSEVTAEWTNWQSVSTITTRKIKLVATKLDTGGATYLELRELQVKY